MFSTGRCPSPLMRAAEVCPQTGDTPLYVPEGSERGRVSERGTGRVEGHLTLVGWIPRFHSCNWLIPGQMSSLHSHDCLLPSRMLLDRNGVRGRNEMTGQLLKSDFVYFLVKITLLERSSLPHCPPLASQGVTGRRL